MSLPKIYYFRGPVNFRNLLRAHRTNTGNFTEETTKKAFERSIDAWHRVGPSRSHSAHASACAYLVIEAPRVTFERTLYVINFSMVDLTRSSNALLSRCTDNHHSFSSHFFASTEMKWNFYSVLFLGSAVCARQTNSMRHRSLIAIFVEHSLLIACRSPQLRCSWKNKTIYSNFVVSHASPICSVDRQQINYIVECSSWQVFQPFVCPFRFGRINFISFFNFN